jgi:hypothetical protein
LRAVRSPEAPKITSTQGGDRRSASTVMSREHARIEQPGTDPGGAGAVAADGMR